MTCLPDLLWDSNEHSPSASEPAFLDLVYDELHRMASSLLVMNGPPILCKPPRWRTRPAPGFRRRNSCAWRTASSEDWLPLDRPVVSTRMA